MFQLFLIDHFQTKFENKDFISTSIFYFFLEVMVNGTEMNTELVEMVKSVVNSPQES